ncbi:MAG: hypothetical protein VB088_07185 [Sphaerochaeta sp.]|jgi:hypothetical protein|uniref:hypothetical protein n=1 Tax=unclassified Sphaerochaeta TaxID=2637943 RepID=UPI000AD2771D|nr:MULTISPECIES: hypothetical protein [unclassified Sphaerochaeta]MCK9601342.1 hypothetical protein [Sphaerochaeta sp.]MDX9823760.1 hypothetical protein [Sphaerochaeta sp.]MEA4865164.1 hypothetical protein [Sphaerochaeta sp.]HAP57718.1 hypothetical protein [Sphaerochaeta sp.]HCU30487.1 hypothetical protein [Sphaerochaeta sp.]
MHTQQKRNERPGRKIGAERRRVARMILRDFYESEQFSNLNRMVQLAMLELCPVQEKACDQEGGVRRLA